MKIQKEVIYKTTLPDGQVLTADSKEELEKLYKTKTTLEKQTVTVEFPFVLIASDYHEFDLYQEILEHVTGKKISYEEFDSEVSTYVAVFWIGEAKPIEEVEKKIKEFKEGE